MCEKLCRLIAIPFQKQWGLQGCQLTALRHCNKQCCNESVWSGSKASLLAPFCQLEFACCSDHGHCLICPVALNRCPSATDCLTPLNHPPHLPNPSCSSCKQIKRVCQLTHNAHGWNPSHVNFLVMLACVSVVSSPGIIQGIG